MITLLVLFIALEIFESNWQKADSILGVIRNNYLAYAKSPFLYFLLNISFIYVLFLLCYLQNYSVWMLSIAIMKFIDISFRLFIIKKIQNDEDIGEIIPVDYPMNFLLRYVNVIIYPGAFLFVIVS